MNIGKLRRKLAKLSTEYGHDVRIEVMHDDQKLSNIRDVYYVPETGSFVIEMFRPEYSERAKEKP